jgi:hypothetical protein
MALNQYGADPTLAAFQGSWSGSALTVLAQYNGVFQFISGTTFLLTFNTGVSKKSAIVQVFGSGRVLSDNAYTILYPEDGGGPSANNQISITFAEEIPSLISIVALNCNAVTA